MLQKIFAYCSGRHTAFAIFFALVGTGLQVYHRLDANYIGLITVIQGWVFAHSYQENKFNKDGGGSTDKGDQDVPPVAPDAK